jgi:ribosomal protein S12 methylthiotransferase accessory factor
MTHVVEQVLLDRLEPLLDAKSGVLRGLDRFIFPAGYAGQMHGFTAIVGRTWALHPLPCRVGSELGELAGHGTALDETTARVRAVCEGLERYCSVMYPTEGILMATARDLGEEALDPGRLPQCSPRERERATPRHRLRIPDLDTRECWVRGYSLTQTRPIWVPLTATYLGLPEPLTAHLAFPESTGFAAGIDYDQAVLAALCEVIERDSLALWWLHQLVMPRIVLDEQVDPPLTELLRRAQRVGIHTDLFDLTTDVGVPVVGLIQTTERGRPHVVIIAACRVDGMAAAVRVLEEAGSLRLALSSENRVVDRESILSGEPHPPEDFGLLYAAPDGPERFAFAAQTPNTRSALPASVKGPYPLATIVRRLANQDMEVIAVDVTLPEIRDFGLVVVRVIVPELMPISFSHSVRYLGHPRLYSAPVRLGYGVRTEEMVTDDPIPYA